MSNTEFGNPNTILDRLRKAYGMVSDAELARFLTVNASTVATWRKKASMKFDPILEVASEINMNWLFYGEGPVWRDELAGPKETNQPEAAAEPGVPYYKNVLPASDGGIIAEKDEEIVWLGLPETFVHQELEADPADLFLTRTHGDGMEPTIHNRDFILVQKNIRHPYAGRIYLIRINESLLCKRIHERPENRLVLLSDNSRYEPLEVETGSENTDIIGRVVWHGRVL